MSLSATVRAALEKLLPTPAVINAIATYDNLAEMLKKFIDDENGVLTQGDLNSGSQFNENTTLCRPFRSWIVAMLYHPSLVQLRHKAARIFGQLRTISGEYGQRIFV